MARFYGSVQGSRGETHRLGTPASGIKAHIAGWQGAVTVELFDENGKDWCHVTLAKHHGEGVHHTLYRGPVGEYRPV